MPVSSTFAAAKFARRLVYAACCLAVAAAAVAPCHAEEMEHYPSRPVRIIVPYGPGGIADVTMRMVAKQLSEHFDQQFFIDNRPGAGGILGMKIVQEAPPDGYTLAMIGGGLTIAKALFKSLPYDIETDFMPISTTASYGLVDRNQGRLAAQDGQGHHRGRQGQSGQAQLRHDQRRQHAASVGRAVPHHGRHQRHDDSLQDDAGPGLGRAARRYRRRLRLLSRSAVADRRGPHGGGRHDGASSGRPICRTCRR